MITNRLLLKPAISFILFIFFIPLFGQQTYIKDRLNFKIANARYHSGWELKNNSLKKIRKGKYRIEGNYGLTNTIEAGVYLGFFITTNFEITNEVDLIPHKTVVPNYGINVNWHILPYFIKSNDFRFDFYLTSKLGGEYHFNPYSTTIEQKHFTEIFGGGGISFYLWKNIGVYTECGYYIIPKIEKLSNLDNFVFTYGLSFKINKFKHPSGK